MAEELKNKTETEGDLCRDQMDQVAGGTVPPILSSGSGFTKICPYCHRKIPIAAPVCPICYMALFDSEAHYDRII